MIKKKILIYSNIIREIIQKKNKDIWNLIPILSISNPIKQYKVKFNYNKYSRKFETNLNIFKLKNYSIDPETNLIFKDSLTYRGFGPIIIFESLDDFVFKKIFMQSKINKKILIKKKVFLKKKNLIFFSIKRNKPNYYHFIEDNLIPFVEFLENFKKINLTIATRFDLSEPIKNYLKILSKIYKFKILKLDKNKVYNFNYLLFVNGNQIQRLRIEEKNTDKLLQKKNIKNIKDIYSIYSVPKGKIIKKENTIYKVGNASRRYLNSSTSYEKFNLFQKKLINLIKVKTKTPEKMFICRKQNNLSHDKKNNFSSRILINENEIRKELKDYTFLYLEDMSVENQIITFNSAKIIVGMSGAGLTNILYCKRNTKIIELRPEFFGYNYNYFSDIAKIKSLKFYPLICQSNNTNDIKLSKKMINFLKNL